MKKGKNADRLRRSDKSQEEGRDHGQGKKTIALGGGHEKEGVCRGVVKKKGGNKGGRTAGGRQKKIKMAGKPGKKKNRMMTEEVEILRPQKKIREKVRISYSGSGRQARKKR